MKRTEEAWKLLLSVVDNFPNKAYMRYNLACYTCQLGEPQDAMTWLEKAIFMGADGASAEGAPATDHGRAEPPASRVCGPRGVSRRQHEGVLIYETLLR